MSTNVSNEKMAVRVYISQTDSLYNTIIVNAETTGADLIDKMAQKASPRAGLEVCSPLGKCLSLRIDDSKLDDISVELDQNISQLLQKYSSPERKKLDFVLSTQDEMDAKGASAEVADEDCEVSITGTRWNLTFNSLSFKIHTEPIAG